ncbi:hypothetical protein SFUMM280S_09573 [Streptomyces fumanus]
MEIRQLRSAMRGPGPGVVSVFGGFTAGAGPGGVARAGASGALAVAAVRGLARVLGVLGRGAGGHRASPAVRLRLRPKRCHPS